MPAKPVQAEGVVAADVPALNYYTPSTLLDAGPVVIEDVPADPPELQGRTETGTMILTLFIGASGAVDDVAVESSDLPEIYTDVVRRNFLGARFSPGMRNGYAVPSSILVEVTFGSATESVSPVSSILAPAATTGHTID